MRNTALYLLRFSKKTTKKQTNTAKNVSFKIFRGPLLLAKLLYECENAILKKCCLIVLSMQCESYNNLNVKSSLKLNGP